MPAKYPGPYFAVAATGDAVYSHNTGLKTNVIRLRRADGRVVTLAEGHHDYSPKISRDGRWMTFIRDAREVVLCERMEAGSPRCETVLRNVDPFEPLGVPVSSDGRVAFLGRETVTGTGTYFLRVLSRDDGQVRDLGEVQATCALHWDDGRTLWYVSQSPAQWVHVDTETGRILERSGKPGLHLADVCLGLPPGVPPNPYRIVEDRPEAIRLFVPPR